MAGLEVPPFQNIDLFRGSLEYDPAAELDLARLAVGGDGGNVAEVCSGWGGYVGRREDGVVEGVEGLEAKLEVSLLSEVEVLQDGRVEVVETVGANGGEGLGKVR